MTTTTPTPPIKVDASARALRTLAQGAAATAVVAIATVVSAVVGGWTAVDVADPRAWLALGGAAVVAVLTSVASYVSRFLVPPQV